jgi:hypothetical protein
MEETYDRVMDRLTVIRGFGELLQEGTFGPITSDQRRVLHELIQEADELHTLLHGSPFPLTTPGSTPRC